MIISTLESGPLGSALFVFERGGSPRKRPISLSNTHEARQRAARRAASLARPAWPAKIAAIVEPVLEDRGFRLVRVGSRAATATTVQIMAERPDGTMTIEECEEISRSISPVLDVARPDAGSTGSRCPRPASTGRWCGRRISRTGSGHEAKVELKELIGGRKRFRGMLEGVRARRSASRSSSIGWDRRSSAAPSGSSPRRSWC